MGTNENTAWEEEALAQDSAWEEEALAQDSAWEEEALAQVYSSLLREALNQKTSDFPSDPSEKTSCASNDRGSGPSTAQALSSSTESPHSIFPEESKGSKESKDNLEREPEDVQYILTKEHWEGKLNAL